MQIDVRGACALISGASGGIGSATAVALDRLGMRVAIMGRDAEKLQKTAALLNNEPIVLQGDLLDRDYLKSAARAVEDAFGRLDVLVNNAGMALSCPFDEVTYEQFDTIMRTNAYAPFLLTQAVLPLLRRSDRAAIVNVTSVVAHKGYPLQSAYAASKHAVYGFTKSLANELYRENIRVHAISPGGVYTDMIRTARPDLPGDGLILPEEIADAIAFLVTHRGNAVIDEIQLHRAGKAPFA